MMPLLELALPRSVMVLFAICLHFASKEQNATCHIRRLFFVLCHVEMGREFNIVSQITLPPKRPNHVSVPTASNLVIYTFAHPPFTIAAVLIGRMACMKETGQSLTKPLRGLSSGGRVCRSGATQGPMQIL